MNWKKRGELEGCGLYRDLYTAVSLAEASSEATSLTSWFAAAWLLERWGRRGVPAVDERRKDSPAVIG